MNRREVDEKLLRDLLHQAYWWGILAPVAVLGRTVGEAHALEVAISTGLLQVVGSRFRLTPAGKVALERLASLGS